MLKNIQNLFQTLQNYNTDYLYIHLLVFIAIFIAIYTFMKYEASHNKLSLIKAKLEADIKKQQELREKEYKKQLMYEGETNKKTRIEKINKRLIDSGLKDKFPELTPELYLFYIGILAVTFGILVSALSHNTLMFFVVIVLTFVMAHVYTEFKIIKNYKSIERNVVKFINILENMSHSSEGLAEIFYKTIPYLSDPLKSSIEKCYYEIKSTGDINTSLQHLIDRTNYKNLKEIFSSFQICASHNEDYKTIIKENKESIRAYISYRKEREAIKKSALTDMIIIGVFGIIILVFMNGMVSNMYELLFHNVIGISMLCAAAGVFIYGIWSTIKADRK